MWIGNEPRWSVPWRRLFRIPDRAITPQEIGQVIQPVAVVASSVHAAGLPGLVGSITNGTSPAVPARRAAIALISTRANAWVQVAYGSATSGHRWAVVPVATFLAGAANNAAVNQNETFGNGTCNSIRADLAGNWVSPGGVIQTAQTGIRPWPDFAMHEGIPLQPGQAFVMYGDADNETLDWTIWSWESQDWVGN